MFERVTKVYLYGAENKADLLPQIAKFRDLEELALYETSIPSGDLEAWMKQHPQVAVTATRNGQVQLLAVLSD